MVLTVCDKPSLLHTHSSKCQSAKDRSCLQACVSSCHRYLPSVHWALCHNDLRSRVERRIFLRRTSACVAGVQNGPDARCEEATKTEHDRHDRPHGGR